MASTYATACNAPQLRESWAKGPENAPKDRMIADVRPTDLVSGTRKCFLSVVISLSLSLFSFWYIVQELQSKQPAICRDINKLHVQHVLCTYYYVILRTQGHPDEEGGKTTQFSQER